MDAVRSRRSAILVLTLIFGLGVEIAYGTPTRAAAELRAAACCADHCDHARPPTSSGRCCGIGQPAGHPGVASVVPGIAPPVALPSFVDTFDPHLRLRSMSRFLLRFDRDGPIAFSSPPLRL